MARRSQMSDSLPDSTVLRPEYIELEGGLDLHTPLLKLKPGVCRDARNFEVSINGGYSRIKGYERYDGQPNPSDANYIGFTLNVTGSLNVGDVMTGVTSGATGKVIYRNGAIVAYTKSTGSFVLGETINVGGTARATVTDTAGRDATDDFDVRMKNLAADEYRADILAIPGSGVTRGVIYHAGVLYGFRDNAGATATAIYKATAAGWVLVPFMETVTFTNANTSVGEGDTLTQGGVTALVRRVCVETGTLASGTNTGRLIVSGRGGGNFAAGAATSTGGGALTVSGIQTTIAPLPGGSYQFDIETVGSERRVYGIDGVNQGFEFDGTVYVPLLVAGQVPDVPQTVVVQLGHLIFTYDNSVQISGIGTPYNWSVTAGGVELLASGAVTQTRRMPGSQSTGAVAISTDDGTQMLYGTSGATFQLIGFEDSSGAKPKSGQRMGALYVFDNQGITSVTTSQNFGNFVSNTLTLNIRSFLQTRRSLCTGTVIVKSKNQYRIFFSDGSGLYITLSNGRMFGAMPVFFTNPVRCVCHGETPNGQETAFFGGDDGFVYRLEAGTSFDGGAIDYDMTLVYANQGALRRDKKYRTAAFEVQGDGYCEFSTMFDLDYGSTDRAQQDVADTAIPLPLSSVFWDAPSFVWDTFTWDGRSLMPVSVKVHGSGENIATRVFGSSDLFDQFTINSEILTYSMRGRKRAN